MSKIDPKIARGIAVDPDKTFNVVITSKGPAGILEQEFSKLKAIEGFSNIFKASVSAKEILEMEKHASIESIYLDDQVGIL